MNRRRLPLVLLAALGITACGTSAPGPTRSTSPSLTPTGGTQVSLEGQLVFAGEDGEIWTMRADGTRARRLTDLPGDQFDPDAASDGNIVFRDSRQGVNVNDDIAIMAADGSKLDVLTKTPNDNEWGPAWSPDGAQIAFSSDQEGIPQIYVMNADGSEVTRLSDVEGEYPAWSPDGSQIAFASYVGGSTPLGDPNYDLFVMNSDGGDQHDVTDDPDAYDMYPTWSPDGEWIAFESTRGTPDDFVPPPYDQERPSDFDIWSCARTDRSRPTSRTISRRSTSSRTGRPTDPGSCSTERDRSSRSTQTGLEKLT